MNDENLFNQLFELFNQPGTVNWRLAAELNRHLAGERQPIEPWIAEEYRDLARLAEVRLSHVSRLPVPSVEEVLPIDARGWAERALSGLTYLGEALAGSFDVGEEGAGPLAPMLKPLGSSLVGMQLGTMVASLGKRVLASFEAGLPVEAPMMVVVPNVETFAAGLDLRQVRLWAVTSEIAHLTVWRVGWLRDHLGGLVAEAGRAARLDLSSMFERFQGFGDPSALQQLAEGEGLADLLDQTASEPARADVDCLLSVTGGYARRLVAQAVGELLPQLARITESFDRRREEPGPQPALVSLFPGPGDPAAGAGFFTEVERRFGLEAPDRVWESPETLPATSDLSDPVGWAARVLLEGF